MSYAEAVLLDFDDTITCSYRTGVEFFREIARNTGIRVPSEREIRKYWGYTIEDIAKNVWDGDYGRFVEAYERRQARVVPFHDGAEDALRLLSSHLPMGIITSRTGEDIRKAFDKLGIDPMLYFMWIFGCDEVECRKPDPRVFNGVLRELEGMGIGKAGTIYTGDHLFDYYAARDAGLGFYGVTTGVHSREEFTEAGLKDEKIIDSLSELPGKLGIDEL